MPSIIAGETIFKKRKQAKNRTKLHQRGLQHVDRMYATGGMVVTVIHNYETNQEEIKYLDIPEAIERYHTLREMVDSKNLDRSVVDTEELLPAILKAIRAAQLQEKQGKGILLKEEELTANDIEAIEAEISGFIAEARKNDPELDKEMTLIEMGKSVE